MNSKNENIDHNLLMLYLSGEADKSQINQVKIWQNQSRENVQYLNKLEELWIETGKLSSSPVAVDIDDAWNKLSDRISLDNEQVLKTDQNQKNKVVYYFTRIAAVIMLLFGAYFIFNYLTEKDTQLTLASNDNVITQILPDGSETSLNINSRLIYPKTFSENKREVKLEGEAFFNVEHKKEQEFIIHAGDANIKVLGTSFNVTAYPESEDIEVFVETGTVLLYCVNNLNGDSVALELTPGTKGIYNKKKKTIKRIVETFNNDLFWNNKTLIFEETELSKVIEILIIDYNVEITLGNEKIKNCLLSAKFKNDSIETILNVIAESFKLNITKKENTYIINGDGC